VNMFPETRRIAGRSFCSRTSCNTVR